VLRGIPALGHIFGLSLPKDLKRFDLEYTSTLSERHYSVLYFMANYQFIPRDVKHLEVTRYARNRLIVSDNATHQRFTRKKGSVLNPYTIVLENKNVKMLVLEFSFPDAKVRFKNSFHVTIKQTLC
jgi:hypothetical protein